MTDALAHFLMLAALVATLGYSAFLHESTCPGCLTAIPSTTPSVALLPIPQLKPIGE